MSTPVAHRSFTIERTYPTTVQRVFRGFSDPARKRRWFAEAEGCVVMTTPWSSRPVSLSAVAFASDPVALP